MLLYVRCPFGLHTEELRQGREIVNRVWRVLFLTLLCTSPTLAAQKDDLLQQALRVYR